MLSDNDLHITYSEIRHQDVNITFELFLIIKTISVRSKNVEKYVVTDVLHITYSEYVIRTYKLRLSFYVSIKTISVRNKNVGKYVVTTSCK
jgi:hypothetical protein